MKVVALLFALAGAAQADLSSPFLTGQVSAGSFFTYSYSLTVPSSASFGANIFVLQGIASALDAAVPPGPCFPTADCGVPAGTFAPAGWSVTVDNVFTNSVYFAASTPLAPGSTLAGFGFYSTGVPSLIQYAIANENFDQFPGSVVGPTATPEPSSWLMLCGGALVLGARRLAHLAVGFTRNQIE